MSHGGLPATRPRTIGVIGGGTAGYLAALAIRRRFPEIQVTVVQSSADPIIGVGEATTNLMPAFLHSQLGLSPVDLFRDVKPTLKLGIKFEWGSHGDFSFPFGDSSPAEAAHYDGDLATQSLHSLLIASDRAPILRGPGGELASLLTRLKFAYHLDNAPFVHFLEAAAAKAGIPKVDAKIEHVKRTNSGAIESLHAIDGRVFEFDLYVDATGFRSLLLERFLESPFESYASSLFCDRAVAARVPQRGTIDPYTTAETMNAGWCWRTPVHHEDHRGYVFSSAFLGDDEAIDEMRRANPGMGEPRIVRFRAGRHREMWLKNVVALGNSYGFVEPLESTALHMVIVGIAYLLAGLEIMSSGGDSEAFVQYANETVGAQWDYLRWFLAVHYKFNRRLDTPFWRAVQKDVDVSGLQSHLDRYHREGPWPVDTASAYDPRNPSIGFDGVITLLLGQKVPGPAGRRLLSPEQWEKRLVEHRRIVRYAIPQRDALAILHEDPRMAAEIVENPRSWCNAARELPRVATGDFLKG